jgi:hypothetical protein
MRFYRKVGANNGHGQSQLLGNDSGHVRHRHMRIQVETDQDCKAVPRSLHRGERRIDIIEITDQWYGAGYRYVKVRGHDGSVYILCWDEIGDQWEMIMFSAERTTDLAAQARCSPGTKTWA